MFRDIIGQAGFRGVPAGNIKPSKRVYGAPPANEQHLHGAAVGITVDSPPERKARGWGDRPAYTHYNTANRTILTDKGWLHQIYDVACPLLAGASILGFNLGLVNVMLWL